MVHFLTMAKLRKRKQMPKKSSPIRSPKGSGKKIKTPPVKAEKRRAIKCSICLDSSRCRKMKYLPCKHKFHQRCVNQWLESHPECPLCRASTDKERKYPTEPTTSGITREELRSATIAFRASSNVIAIFLNY